MTDADPDAALLARVAAGDEAAVRSLVVTRLPRVLALAQRMLGERGEAEDVAQEAFARTWRHAARWEAGRAKLDTWLHTVVLNLCRDRMRRRREATGVDLPERADPAPLAEAAMIADERAAAVQAAIADLPDRQREAILLVHYQDLSGADAAAALGVSVEALESLLSRGRRSLRQRLAGSEE